MLGLEFVDSDVTETQTERLLEPRSTFSDFTKHPSDPSISVQVVGISHFKWSCQLHFGQYSSIEGLVFLALSVHPLLAILN